MVDPVTNLNIRSGARTYFDRDQVGPASPAIEPQNCCSRDRNLLPVRKNRHRGSVWTRQNLHDNFVVRLEIDQAHQAGDFQAGPGREESFQAGYSKGWEQKEGCFSIVGSIETSYQSDRIER